MISKKQILWLIILLVATTLAQAQAQTPSQKLAEVPLVTTKIAETPSNRSNVDAKDLATAKLDPLVQILVNKGIISVEEWRTLGTATIGQRAELITLLHNKGIISDLEFTKLNKEQPSINISSDKSLINSATNDKPVTQPLEPIKPVSTTPKTNTAIAPIRVLLSEVKRDGLVPDLKLGSGVNLKFYGLFRTGVVHDSSSPLGNDFPLPGFLSDTGPDLSPEFHIKARSLRLGANFEWHDPAPNMAITGRLEFDFEGSFTRSNNRNISSIRSSQPSLRLAWGRIDWKWNDKQSMYALFGQDWTPFGSSTLPNLLETTGLGIGYGVISERAPQVRIGYNLKTNLPRGLSFQPEFAFVLPAFGNLPTSLSDQEGFGERQGADSARPEIQGRLVTQFQLDKAEGVAPAQFIVSFVNASRRVIVRAQDVPTAFKSAFPQGSALSTQRYGYTVEAQLPTRFVTVLAKYYRGADLRFYFAGQLYSNFNDTAGLTNLTAAPSIDGASSVFFGLLDGVPTLAPQRSVRTNGGFINLGFPLSRLFQADPKGRQAGWTAYLHYSFDQAVARDVRRFGNRSKSDLFSASLYYKLNSFITFGYEESLYRTRAANNSPSAIGGLPLLRGLPARETHNIRSEFATIFTF